jgi:hypothetical protein
VDFIAFEAVVDRVVSHYSADVVCVACPCVVVEATFGLFEFVIGLVSGVVATFLVCGLGVLRCRTLASVVAEVAAVRSEPLVPAEYRRAPFTPPRSFAASSSSVSTFLDDDSVWKPRRS